MEIYALLDELASATPSVRDRAARFFVFRYGPGLQNVVTRYAPTPEDSRDWLQDLSKHLLCRSDSNPLPRIARYREEPVVPFEAWLRTVAKNHCLDKVRNLQGRSRDKDDKKSRRPQLVSLDSPLREGEDNTSLSDRIAGNHLTPEDGAIASEQRKKIAKIEILLADCMETFSDRDQRILEDWSLGLSAKDIARLHQLADPKTVDRVREKLKYNFTGILKSEKISYEDVSDISGELEGIVSRALKILAKGLQERDPVATTSPAG
jgi:RNA polymerase sigma factor (sigma-70 family)